MIEPSITPATKYFWMKGYTAKAVFTLKQHEALLREADPDIAVLGTDQKFCGSCQQGVRDFVSLENRGNVEQFAAGHDTAQGAIPA